MGRDYTSFRQIMAHAGSNKQDAKEKAKTLHPTTDKKIDKNDGSKVSSDAVQRFLQQKADAEKQRKRELKETREKLLRARIEKHKGRVTKRIAETFHVPYDPNQKYNSFNADSRTYEYEVKYRRKKNAGSESFPSASALPSNAKPPDRVSGHSTSTDQPRKEKPKPKPPPSTSFASIMSLASEVKDKPVAVASHDEQKYLNKLVKSKKRPQASHEPSTKHLLSNQDAGPSSSLKRPKLHVSKAEERPKTAVNSSSQSNKPSKTIKSAERPPSRSSHTPSHDQTVRKVGKAVPVPTKPVSVHSKKAVTIATPSVVPKPKLAPSSLAQTPATTSRVNTQSSSSGDPPKPKKRKVKPSSSNMLALIQDALKSGKLTDLSDGTKRELIQALSRKGDNAKPPSNNAKAPSNNVRPPSNNVRPPSNNASISRSAGYGGSGSTAGPPRIKDASTNNVVKTKPSPRPVSGVVPTPKKYPTKLQRVDRKPGSYDPCDPPFMSELRRPAEKSNLASHGDDSSDAEEVSEYDEEEEYDSDIADFIDDSELPNATKSELSRTLKEVFGYDRSKYRNERDSDLRKMEASYRDIAKEEARSLKLGMLEDLEDIEREEQMSKKLKKKS